MKLQSVVVIAALGGCGVDQVSTAEQPLSADHAIARFRMTGEAAWFTGTTDGPPWTIQTLAVDRYVTDTVPPAPYVQYDSVYQDPESLFLGPYGYYYAKSSGDFIQGSLPPGAVQASGNNAQLHATLPANSDTFFSQHCEGDDRIGYHACKSLEGQTIDVEWQSTGEMDVVNGIWELDFGSITFRIMGRSTMAVAHATGTVAGEPLRNEAYSAVMADRGAGVWLSVEQP